MNTAKIYKDFDGKDLTIHQMVKAEPGWAAARVQVGEEALALLEKIKVWNADFFQEHGEFPLPKRLHEEINRASV